jgi:hypothetical protein
MMRVRKILVYLLFALSSWTFMTISTFELMRKSNFNTQLTAEMDCKEKEKIVKKIKKAKKNLGKFEHFWGGEHEESRKVLFTKFSLGNTSYALAKDEYYDDETNIYVRDLSNNNRTSSRMKV